MIRVPSALRSACCCGAVCIVSSIPCILTRCSAVRECTDVALQLQPSSALHARLCCFVPAPQDLKCFVFSLISAHFKIQPIQK